MTASSFPPPHLVPMVWVKPDVAGARPSGRGGCAAAVVGDMFLFIGGADRTPRAFDDVWILRLIASPDVSSAPTARWVRKTTTFAGPGRLPQRSGATATAVGRKVYVFGGQDPTRGTCFNDVVVLDCDDWLWSRLPIAGASPPPRNAHVACSIANGRLIVVHGGSSPEDGPMGDVHVLDLMEGAERWTRPKVAGQAPEPREMHAACAIDPPRAPNPSLSSEQPSSSLLITGGRGRAGVLRDAVVLETSPEMRWARRGDLGRAACAHAAVPWRLRARESDAADENDAALHFGGFDGAALRPPELFATDAETMATLAIGEVDGAPEPRFAHACVSAEGPWGAGGRRVRAMVVFGGVTPEADLADVAVYFPDGDGRGSVEAGPGIVPAADLD